MSTSVIPSPSSEHSPIAPEGASRAVDGSGQMFDAIAERYDRLNRILSLGSDQRWRRRVVKAIAPKPDDRVLDLATGTADMALQVLREEPRTVVIGLDPSSAMLAVGRAKVLSAGLEDRIHLQLGDAQHLPFADDAFDSVTIAFGIRNVSDRSAAMREMSRVTRPGGRIAILELTEPVRGPMAPLARWHIHHLVPRIGAILSGEPQYRYLQRSIAHFPAPGRFVELMQESGLAICEASPLSFGVCHLFVAEPAERRA